MNLIPEDMTTEAPALIERAIQLQADATALVDDIKAFSLRRADLIPEGLSIQAQDELYGWSARALGVDEMCRMLDATVSTILAYHDSGVDVFSDDDVAERVTLAHLTLAALVN